VKIPTTVARIDRDFWAGRRVLLTGHTGFKGAWTALWLQELGARVTGLALAGAPTRPSLYELARVGEGMRERTADEAVEQERPEVVLHLAAQPLVRLGYREPALTYEVNVMGTVNLLEAVRRAGAEVRAVVVVTSDKCYENPTPRVPVAAGARGAGSAGDEDDISRVLPGTDEQGDGPASDGRRFVEGDPLGGEDPYSSSKACAELVAAAYRSSYFSAGASANRDGGADRSPSPPIQKTQIATARAGNVIGGGDWGSDRLIPDIVRAVEAGEPVRVRNPGAVRPWQHVLNPLSGYLTLAQELCREDSPEVASAWNFGPAREDARTVGWVVRRLADYWAGALRWEADGGESGELDPPEAGHLALDSSKAEHGLGWRPAWGLEEALERVVSWHEAHRRGEDMRTVSLAQIAELG
jgi:CDP-glucose 4,6-dehydratase